MKLETFTYSADTGWSKKKFPKLDSENTLILIFASPEYINNPSPILELKKKYPKSQLIGCSSSGEILGSFVWDKSISLASISEHDIVVSIMHFEHATFKTIITECDDKINYFTAGESIYNQVYDDDLKGILILSECKKTNFSSFVKGLNAKNNHKHCIIEGLASGAQDYEQSFVIVNGEIKKNHIIALGFYGDKFHMGYGLSKESELYVNDKMQVLAISQLNESDVSHEEEEDEVEEALTALPKQTKLIGFYSASNFINSMDVADKKKPYITIYEDLSPSKSTTGETHLFNGKKIANQIFDNIKNEVNQLTQAIKRPPTLAILYIDDASSGTLYLRQINKSCSDVGIKLDRYPFGVAAHTEELISIINNLNEDATVDGIQLQMPVPKHLDINAIIDHISPEKDIDGVHPYNLGLAMQGRPYYQSCSAQSVMLLLDSIQCNLKGMHAVVVGASNVGKPIVTSLINANCTVSVCNVYTPNLARFVSQADILVTAVGKEKLIKGEWVKQNAIVIDLGTALLPDGTIEGDVEFDVASQKSTWITPVPGGVGPITVAVLLQHTLYAALKSNGQIL